MRRTALAAAAVLAVAACGGGGGGEPTPSAAPTTTAPPSTPLSTPSSTGPAWPAGCASPPALPAGATVIEATVTGGKVSPARRTYEVRLNSAVRLLVTADVADEVHVHSYDLHAATKPGCPAAVDLQARVPGTVEVELEGAHLHLFDVRAQ